MAASKKTITRCVFVENIPPLTNLKITIDNIYRREQVTFILKLQKEKRKIILG